METFGAQFALVTSFQAEGMVLLDMAARIDPAVRVITLDTGRLPPETFTIMNAARERYGVSIETVTPDPAEVAGMVARFGPNLFYDEPALRNLCCEIRKVRPLERVLRDVRAYAVGLRRGQSDARQAVAPAEEIAGRWKLSPLATWTREDVWRHIREHDVPVHPLYAKGYQSIGCDPCTRAVQPGEPERSGRWWWEEDSLKECGLHFSTDGRARRRVDVMLEEVIRG